MTVYIHFAIWLVGCGLIALGAVLLTGRSRVLKILSGLCIPVGGLLVLVEVYLPFPAASLQLHGHGFWPSGTLSYADAQGRAVAIAALGIGALLLGTLWLVSRRKPNLGRRLGLAALADAVAVIAALLGSRALFEQVPGAALAQQPAAWSMGSSGTAWSPGALFALAQQIETGFRVLTLGGVVAAVLALWAASGLPAPSFLTRRVLGINNAAFGLLVVGFAFYLRVLCVDAVYWGLVRI